MFRLVFAVLVIVVVGFIWYVTVQYQKWTEKQNENKGTGAPKQPSE